MLTLQKMNVCSDYVTGGPSANNKRIYKPYFVTVVKFYDILRFLSNMTSCLFVYRCCNVSEQLTC